eukprot:1159094-Pelagomonas_calceolata.AAC.6
MRGHTAVCARISRPAIGCVGAVHTGLGLRMLGQRVLSVRGQRVLGQRVTCMAPSTLSSAEGQRRSHHLPCTSKIRSKRLRQSKRPRAFRKRLPCRQTSGGLSRNLAHATPCLTGACIPRARHFGGFHLGHA